MSSWIVYGCTTRKDEPHGVIARSEWMDKMSKTHKQSMCNKCGLFHVWKRKKKKRSK